MKSTIRFLCILLAGLLFCLPVMAITPSTEKVSNAIQKVCPTRFGYIDNSQYYMSSYFSGLFDVDDFYIVTCADSTDFSEFGVFHLKDTEHLTQNQKILKRYLHKIKKNFESGVVYNTGEYPKFENAKVFYVGNYLVYTVLDREHVLLAEQALHDMIK